MIETIIPDATPLDDTDNPRVVNGYDNAGRLVSVTDANGNTTRYEYDKASRRTKVITALNEETTFIYDNRDRRVRSIDALGRETNFEYDDRGNLTKTIFANGTFNTTTYDELNRKVAETDLAGQLTTYEYDAAGNLIAVVDALNQRTEYGYDQRGNKVSQTDANGHTTTWNYDELSRVISITLPEGQVETYAYDGVGNMISKTDFNGDLTTYTYNNLNQQIKTEFADMTSIVTTYNDVQLMETITEVNGITFYQYDEENRLTRIDYPTGNYIEYQYDKQGNRTQMKTASHTVDYTFDVLNRMSTVTDANGTTSYSYDAVGNRATQSNANGTVVTYMYDQLNRLVDLTHTDSNNTVIASYAYTLGANGNRLSITEATGRVVNYQYDDTYRLLAETVTDPINGDHSSEWAYDAVGNRLQQLKDGVVTTYIYDDNDQIQSETENAIITSYAYDANGNTLTKSIGGTVDSSYVYSKQNRLLEATTPSGTIINTYDAAGIRQSQSVNGTMTHYLVDKNRPYAQVIEEQNDLFIPQTTYTYGDDLINQTNNQGTHTFGYDGLGSTRILTDATGTVQNAYGYEAFGELDYQIGILENKYLFTGEQYDNNVGFYYLRARYYNPNNGRFTLMDTFDGRVHEPLSLHKYLYANGNPSNMIDPSGNFSIGRVLIAGVVLGITGGYAIAPGGLNLYNKVKYYYGNGSEIFIDFSSFKANGYDVRSLEVMISQKLTGLFGPYDISITSGKGLSYDKTISYRGNSGIFGLFGDAGFNSGRVWEESIIENLTTLKSLSEQDNRLKLTLSEVSNAITNITAHEIGHILGADHVIGSEYIMDEGSDDAGTLKLLGLQSFSPSTINYLLTPNR